MRLALELGGLTPEEINQSYRSLIDLLLGLDLGVDFTLANSIWYRQEYTFEPAFLDTNRVYFDARIQGLDFAAPSAPGTIDGWVSEQTRGRIVDQLGRPARRSGDNSRRRIPRARAPLLRYRTADQTEDGRFSRRLDARTLHFMQG